jgi:hypothetical protein
MPLTIEHFVLIAIAAISIASIFYIPKSKYRLALISYLVFQAITWSGSLILIQMGWIEYPVREFPRATQGGFIQLYIFIPMVYAWFILIFPYNASLVKKMLHYFIFASIIVWLIYFMSYYTNLEKSYKGTVLFQVIGFYIRFIIYFKICHIYILWFSKRANLPTGE